MTRPEPPEKERPAWAGAPGYHPGAEAARGGEPEAEPDGGTPPGAADPPTAGSERDAAASEAAVAPPVEAGAGPEAGDPRPSGFQAYPEQYAHAPMPGAPPYPAPPPLEGPLSTRTPAAGTTYPVALGATGVWFVVNVVQTLAVYGRIGVGTIGAMIIVAALAALPTWLIARHRRPAFWQLVLLAIPFYWILRFVLFSRQVT